MKQLVSMIGSIKIYEADIRTLKHNEEVSDMVSSLFHKLADTDCAECLFLGYHVLPQAWLLFLVMNAKLLFNC